MRGTTTLCLLATIRLTKAAGLRPVGTTACPHTQHIFASEVPSPFGTERQLQVQNEVGCGVVLWKYSTHNHPSFSLKMCFIRRIKMPVFYLIKGSMRRVSEGGRWT